ncbi:MAG TPA: DUF6427 family protein [Chryseolinea sp.]|nr:DUF6427 family protein [Chryseolinea sp.]
MLQYFRINDPYRLLGLLAIFILITLPFFIDAPELTYPELKGLVIGEKVHEGASLYTELVDSSGPLAGWFNGLIDVVFGRSMTARHILSFVLIFLQAAYIGIVFSNQKAFAEHTYIPSLIYVIAFCFSFDTLSLTPELLGAGALLPALSSLFKEIEFREQRSESIFSLGLYISIASLFSFSYSVLLIGSFITLMVFTRSNVRKYLLLIVGFALPHLLLLAIYFLKDGLSAVWQFYYVPNFSIHAVRYMSSGALWTLLTLPLIFLVVSVVMMNREARLSKYQTQLVQAMFFWTLFALGQVFISRDFRPQNFVSVIPGLCFFITHFLLIVPKRKFAEIAIWVFLAGTVLISNLARYGALDSVNYRDLIVRRTDSPYKGKRLLVLDEGWEVYANNQLASPFLDWNMSRSIFSQPEYYENVILVSNGLKNDLPEIIRDKHNLLQPYLDRLPELRKHYRRQGDSYVRTDTK